MPLTSNAAPISLVSAGYKTWCRCCWILYLFGSRLSSFFITFVVRWSELLHKSFSFDLCSVFPIHVKISNICMSDKVANTISNIIKVFLPLKIDHIKIEAVIFRWNLFSTSVRCHVDHFYYHYMLFFADHKAIS